MPTEPTPAFPTPQTGTVETRFVNGMRLSPKQWLAVAVIVGAVLQGAPWVWKKIEHFKTGKDYRIPYALSKDYWLYERRLEKLAPTNVVVLGDSVVWGEYVRPEGTLSHFLNAPYGATGPFVNAGVNGLFPLALEGLIRDYGHPLRHTKILLQCNVLWMSSPKADLHTEKEERFNHAGLVPQFRPRIPCYRADLNQRLSAVVERHFTFSQWATHLQVAYFGQRSLLSWTLEEDGGNPPRYPNAYKNPFAQITLTIPPEPTDDPERGSASARHQPWSTTGEGSTRFGWVNLEDSLQWAAFQRLVTLLQARDNKVLVLVGPFNEHIMAEDNRAAFRRMRDGITRWLVNHQVEHLVPSTLPSLLYADASHPLTEGYQLLADRLADDPVWQQWLETP